MPLRARALLIDSHLSLMTASFRHAALIGKHDAAGMRELLQAIAEFVTRRGVYVSFESETARRTGVLGQPVVEPEEIGHRCDLAIVVGGDGTMLRFARLLAPHGTPLLGINRGRLGFITDVAVDVVWDALASIVAGDYVCDRRPLLEGSVWRDGAMRVDQPAVNDVVVSRGATSGMVELALHVGDEFVADFRADGLIVASPTGSTAYALAADGPILHPAMSGWVVAPIAPHDLSNRPIVIPDTHVARVELVAGRQASATFDGRSAWPLERGDRVCVRRSVFSALFVHPPGWSYYATLRAKLHWYEGAHGHQDAARGVGRVEDGRR